MLTMPAVFFFNDTATTEIYTLSLHDALPIWRDRPGSRRDDGSADDRSRRSRGPSELSENRCRADRRARRSARHRFSESSEDRKSTRLNSSHLVISYAVFCLKKKKQQA